MSANLRRRLKPEFLAAYRRHEFLLHPANNMPTVDD